MKQLIHIFITVLISTYITSPIRMNVAFKMPEQKQILAYVSSSESTGNTTNQGFALEDSEHIYYSDGFALWSMKQDGNEQKKISDGAALNIQVAGEFIYYIEQDTSEIYKIRKDGTGKKRISGDKAYSLNIYKDKIYFMDRYNQLYITAMSLEGKNKTVILPAMTNDIQVYNDYIYYVTRKGDLGKVQVDGSNNEILQKDVLHFDVAQSGLYYVYDPRKPQVPKGLYRYDLTAKNEIQLMKETPYNFNVRGHIVYYNHPTKMTLYSMLSDGTNKAQVVGTNTSEMNIAGQYIFYKNLEDNKKIYRVNQNGTNRISLEGITKVTSVEDLAKEINDLENKEFSPKLKRAYEEGKTIVANIIHPQMTDYEKVRKIHDYIITSTTYDIEAAESFLEGKDADANAFTAYGVLINQKGVCQGYAEAAQILFSLAGIRSQIVIGNVKDEDGNIAPHMWNIVWVNGKSYMIDITWDDPVGDKQVLLHDYFLVDDETMKETHSWAYDEYPECKY